MPPSECWIPGVRVHKKRAADDVSGKTPNFVIIQADDEI